MREYGYLLKTVGKDQPLLLVNGLLPKKNNLLLKLFDANELLNSVKIENMTLLKKVKSLELELFVARKQIDRTFTSKLNDMLHVQKFVSNKTGLGFVESGSTIVVNPPKFVPTTSFSVVHPTLSKVKEVVLASRRTRVDLSESKPKNPNQSESKKNHKS